MVPSSSHDQDTTASVEQSKGIFIFTEGGLLLFSRKLFDTNAELNPFLLGGLISSIRVLSEALLIQEKIDALERIIFKNHTVLITRIESFLICYIYTGYSPTAEKKLQQVLAIIQQKQVIWEALVDGLLRGRVIPPKIRKIFNVILDDIFLGN